MVVPCKNAHSQDCAKLWGKTAIIDAIALRIEVWGRFFKGGASHGY